MKSIKSTVLDKAYKDERDADVRERILLVIRVLSDNQHIESVAHEIHRSRSWAYKWYMRYNYDQGIEGLKDQPRSGRPPFVDNDMILKIRKELSDSSTGWDFRQQVMDIIQKRTGVKYHEVHIYRLLHRWGFVPKVPQKKFIRTASQKEKKSFKKEYKRL